MPAILESYFQASNADDIEALVASFVPDATVRDESHTHCGTAAIKTWAIDVRKKYEFKIEVLRAVQTGDATIVTVKVFGSFPGSPVNLDFKFTLRENKITSLAIG